ncbi:hypothetical protein D7193_11620 [Micromonospora costi]|uniref:FAD-binding domain-containing protein n=1 Tax=Micromonospora costi TaxID=1530042 RepID=A0A3B0A7R0_9ACTN|nr:hypothetical protein D7193_11620 [Micromonospora costi]
MWLVDRATDRVHESRALAVQSRTLEVLAGFGLADKMVAAGNPAVRLIVHAGRRQRPVRLFDLGLCDTSYPYLLFLSQAETERLLGEYLATLGVSVERGVELVGLDRTDQAVVGTLRDRDGHVERMSARYVVGCDGAQSAVRRFAGIGFGRQHPSIRDGVAVPPVPTKPPPPVPRSAEIGQSPSLPYLCGEQSALIGNGLCFDVVGIPAAETRIPPAIL